MAISRGRSLPTNPNELLACESDIDSNTDNEGSYITSSTLNEVNQDASSDFWMAISALWGVFADVGGYWQSVSLRRDFITEPILPLKTIETKDLQSCRDLHPLQVMLSLLLAPSFC